MAEGLELDDLQGPFQPKPFYDSVILSFEDLLQFIVFMKILAMTAIAYIP